MSLIKPRTRGKDLVTHRVRFDPQTTETLYAYAHFIGESTEYVLTQAIDNLLAKDKEFAQWRAEHPSSFVPRHVGRNGSGRGRRRMAAVATS
jgi:hypothetical protein